MEISEILKVFDKFSLSEELKERIKGFTQRINDRYDREMNSDWLSSSPDGFCHSMEEAYGK